MKKIAPWFLYLLSLSAVCGGGDPFIGEIIWVAFDVIPRGWAPCDGRLLSTSGNATLFTLFGYTYGGSGAFFAIPDARGRTLIGTGQGQDLSDRALGATGGEETVTLTIDELPTHNHSAGANSSPGTTDQPANGTFADRSDSYVGGTPNANLNSCTIGNAGGDMPHSNMAPYIALNCLVALQGVNPLP